jgi:RimJ/RimL family protein N-acetyltransferase
LRLVLRPLSLSDAEALLPVFQDVETMRYWAFDPVESVEELRARITYNIPAEGPPNSFAIAESESGPALGWVNVYAIQDGGAGAGYILNAAARGRGYAHEAMVALLNYAFGERNLHRVYLDIDPENSASIRLAQRLGFRWEGHFKQSFLRSGVYYDSVFYAMLASEWRTLRGSAIRR